MDDTTSDMIFYGESGWLPRHNVTQYTRCGHYTIPPPSLHGVGRFPFPPSPSANSQRSSVNVYKIDNG